MIKAATTGKTMKKILFLFFMANIYLAYGAERSWGDQHNYLPLKLEKASALEQKFNNDASNFAPPKQRTIGTAACFPHKESPAKMKKKFESLRAYQKTLPKTPEALYPTEEEKYLLAQKFELTKKQIETSFSNFRERNRVSTKKKTNKKLAEIGGNWLFGASVYLLSNPPIDWNQTPALMLTKEGYLYKYDLVPYSKEIFSNVLNLFDLIMMPGLKAENFKGAKVPLSLAHCQYLNSIGANILTGKNLSDPYPSRSEIEYMAAMSASSVEQVKDWFINFRRRKLGGGQQKKMKKGAVHKTRRTTASERPMEFSPLFAGPYMFPREIPETEPVREKTDIVMEPEHMTFKHEHLKPYFTAEEWEAFLN